MAGFFGKFEHTIDDKGRVVLPSKFRPAFERGGYLTQHDDGCLALWPPDAFEAQMAQVQEEAKASTGARNMARYRASTTHETDVDRQGRMVIPARLRAFAQIDMDVWVLGAIDRVELWDPGRWNERVGKEESRLREGEEI